MIIVGIDEVGRGCWAGPLVAGAVVLSAPISGLKDSKLLSKKQREYFSREIYLQAIATGIGWVDVETIDTGGLTSAVKLAMQRALDAINVAYDKVIIDGSFNFLPDESKATALIKADTTVPAVSAASIIAKVARDDYMSKIAKEYPDYGFEQHVGYGTALHIEKLRLHGVSTLHRRSYKPIQALLQYPV